MTDIHLFLFLGLVVGLLGLVLLARRKRGITGRIDEASEKAVSPKPDTHTNGLQTYAEVLAAQKWYQMRVYQVLVGVVAFVLCLALFQEYTSPKAKSKKERQAERVGLTVAEREQFMDEIGFTDWVIDKECTDETEFCIRYVDDKGIDIRPSVVPQTGEKMWTCVFPSAYEHRVEHPLMVILVKSSGEKSKPIHWKQIPEEHRGLKMRLVAPLYGKGENEKLLVFVIRKPKAQLEQFVVKHRAKQPGDMPSLCHNFPVNAVLSGTRS